MAWERERERGGERERESQVVRPESRWNLNPRDQTQLRGKKTIDPIAVDL